MLRLALLSISILATAAPSAQSPSPPAGVRPRFEVATIKPNRSVESGWSFGAQPGGVWRMVNLPISRLIREAYPTPSGDLVGAPDWVTSDRYDVIAKGEGTPTREQIRQMLQTLLMDRFKLAAHDEMRERPVFSLVLARSDGRLGAGLQASKVDCDAVNKARSEGRKPDGPMPANGAAPCSWSSRAVDATTGTTLLFGGLPLTRLGEAIGQQDGRLVIDKTGLKGNYEFTLRYSTSPTGGDVPSVFTALEEQLGLKLVSDRAQLQVLVIDQIERPTEN